MKKTKIIRAIGGIDDDLVERAGQKNIKKRKSFMSWLKWAVPVAACFLVAVWVALPLLNSSGDFDLIQSSGVSVRRINNPPNIQSSSSLAHLTEEELFAERTKYGGNKIFIFEGIIREIHNIEIDFNGHSVYRAFTKIEVTDVIRGNMKQGDIVSILLPAPIRMKGLWVSETEVISHMKSGMKGFFMPFVYDETSIIEMNGATLVLSEIAEYGLADGERWAFLETSNGLVFARWAYESIADAETLDEIRQYINTMIGQN